ncbi:hypothetical protein NEMIN01_2518, partial [Nematocida minor]|uniref:uncharacterized protein n=1 Tax=Nematocida minor TaxID=1912983 RepID=UPI002220B1D6
MKLKEVMCISGILALFIIECRGGNDDSDTIDNTTLSKAKKRKASEITSSEKDHTAQQKPKKKAGNEIEKEKPKRNEGKIEIKDLDFELWNKKRLDNIRRKSYRLAYNSLRNHKSLNIDTSYIEKFSDRQEKLKKDIKEYSDLALEIEDSLFLYFIASSTTSTNAKYKECFGLKELFKNNETEYIEKIEKFKGYYSRIIDDLIAYTDKHQQIKIFKSSSITEWKETFGDIYMRKCLDV